MRHNAWIKAWFLFSALTIFAFLLPAGQGADKTVAILSYVFAASLATSLAAVVALSVWGSLALLAYRWYADHGWRKTVYRVGLCLAVTLAAAMTGLVLLFLHIDGRVFTLFGRHIGRMEWQMFATSDIAQDIGMGREVVRSIAWRAAIGFGVLLGLATLSMWAVRRFPRRLWWGTLAVLGLCTVVGQAIALVGKGHRVRAAQTRVAVLNLLASAAEGDRGAGVARYPLREYGSPITRPVRNILFVVVESLRHSALNKVAMPNAEAIARGGYVGQRHYSGGNGTHLGLFSLVFGANNTLGPYVVSKELPSYPVSWLRKSGYHAALYSSSSMSWFRMRQTLFRGFDRVVEAPVGKQQDAWMRDEGILSYYLAELGRGPQRPRLDFLFFDATHAVYFYPPEFERFRPAAGPMEVVESGGPDKRRRVTNRYLNSAAYVDSLIGRLRDALVKRGTWNNTIVVITGDHGESLGENGKYLHGNVAMDDEELWVPLVIHGIPELKGESRVPSGHEQLLPTIVKHLAPNADASGGGGRPLGAPGALPILVSAGCDAGLEMTCPTWVAVFEHERLLINIDRQLNVLSSEEPIAFPNAPAQRPSKSALLERAAERLRDFRQQGEKWCARHDVDRARFFVCQTLLGWHQGAQWCEANKMQLARVDSVAQGQALMRKGVLGWIGVTANDKKWLDGTPVKLEATGPWNRADKNGVCAILAHPTFGQWGLRNCHGIHSFVCRGSGESLREPRLGSLLVTVTRKDCKVGCEGDLVVPFYRAQPPAAEGNTGMVAVAGGMFVRMPQETATLRADLLPGPALLTAALWVGGFSIVDGKLLLPTQLAGPPWTEAEVRAGATTSVALTLAPVAGRSWPTVCVNWACPKPAPSK